MNLTNGTIAIFAEKTATDPRFKTRTTVRGATLYEGATQWRYLQEDRNTPTPSVPRETATIEALIPYTPTLPPTKPLSIEIQTNGHTLRATARMIEHLQLVRKTRVTATLSHTTTNESRPTIQPSRG